MKQKGFTLIELMITVAVLGILVAIALPSFQKIIEKRRLVGAADNLTASIQYARSEAIKQNQIVRFQFNTASWCTGVDDVGSDCDCTAPATCTINSVQKIVSGSDYANVTLAITSGFASGTDIDFDPRQGLPSNSGELTLDINGQSKTVTLNAIGRIKVD